MLLSMHCKDYKISGSYYFCSTFPSNFYSKSQDKPSFLELSGIHSDLNHWAFCSSSLQIDAGQYVVTSQPVIIQKT